MTTLTHPNDNEMEYTPSEGAHELLLLLKEEAPLPIYPFQITEGEISQSEMFVIGCALELVGAGLPIKIEAVQPFDPFGYPECRYTIGLASTPGELETTQAFLDELLAEVQAARAGLQEAAEDLAGGVGSHEAA